jgi:Mobilization protein NikA
MSAPEFVDFDDDAPEQSPARDPNTIELPHLPPPAGYAQPPRKKGETRRGRHFGPRPVDDPLDAWLPPTRCTQAQRAQADAEAKDAGMSLNGYVRWRMFGTAGPRTHRNPTEATKLLSQILGQLGKSGGNLNQGIRALHQLNIVAGEGEGRDRLAELIEDMAEQHEQAIAEHRECVAAILRALGLRPNADHY